MIRWPNPVAAWAAAGLLAWAALAAATNSPQAATTASAATTIRPRLVSRIRREGTAPAARGAETGRPTRTGRASLAGPSLAGTGLAGTGLAGTGLAGTGIAGTGLAGTGLAGRAALAMPSAPGPASGAVPVTCWIEIRDSAEPRWAGAGRDDRRDDRRA
jgi:hypothetical protein